VEKEKERDVFYATAKRNERLREFFKTKYIQTQYNTFQAFSLTLNGTQLYYSSNPYVMLLIFKPYESRRYGKNNQISYESFIHSQPAGSNPTLAAT